MLFFGMKIGFFIAKVVLKLQIYNFTKACQIFGGSCQLKPRPFKFFTVSGAYANAMEISTFYTSFNQ